MKGTIKAKLVSEAVYDETDGNLVDATTTFGLPIPCKYISANRNDVVNIGDGTFEQARYIITIRPMDFVAKQVVLFDSRGKEIADNDVRVLEVLENIKRVKIVI